MTDTEASADATIKLLALKGLHERALDVVRKHHTLLLGMSKTTWANRDALDLADAVKNLEEYLGEVSTVLDGTALERMRQAARDRKASKRKRARRASLGADPFGLQAIADRRAVQHASLAADPFAGMLRKDAR